MISERGGKIRGLGLVKRGGNCQKNLSPKGGPRVFGPQIQRRKYVEIFRRIRFRGDGVLPRRR